MFRLFISLLFLAVSITAVTLDHIKTSRRLMGVNAALDELVSDAKYLENRLRQAGTVYVGDIMDDAELFEFMTDGRMSVAESPGTTISWEMDGPVIGDAPDPEELEPVIVVRTFVDGRFGMVFVHRGRELYRTYSLYDGIEWFLNSGL